MRVTSKEFQIIEVIPSQPRLGIESAAAENVTVGLLDSVVGSFVIRRADFAAFRYAVNEAARLLGLSAELGERPETLIDKDGDTWHLAADGKYFLGQDYPTKRLIEELRDDYGPLKTFDGEIYEGK